MSRSPVLVRDAEPSDVGALVEVWAARTAERVIAPPTEQDASAAVARSAADPDQRLVVACVEGKVAGAVQLMRGPLTPIHSESAIYVLHLQVLDGFRRQGVGRALLGAAVTWAEEKDTSHLVAAAGATSRDANRFMARLGLGQFAVVRGTTVAAMRAKLPVEAPAAARLGSRSHRSVSQVLVQRRSLRRSQHRAT